jgi:hypothetical protein
MVKAKIYKDIIKNKVSISIENGTKEIIFWIDEIEIEGKLLRNLAKTFNKAGYIENADYRL